MTSHRSNTRVILGLMTFGPDISSDARITSMDEYKRCLDYFQQRGYGECDTSRIYVNGKQEGWTADAGWKERSLTLATKVYPTEPGYHKAKKLREEFHRSLQALRTHSVDIFYLHAADRSVPFPETLQALNELYREGCFKRWGLSNFVAFEIAEIVTTCRARGWVQPTIYQGMYNCITRSLETEVVPACRRYGLDIVVYNPLAGGLLSGKITSMDVPADGRYSNTDKWTGKIYRERYFRDSTFDALRLIKTACRKYNISLVETAFRWIVHHSALRIGVGESDGLLIGISRFEQLRDNLDAIEAAPLPEEVVQSIEAAWLLCKASSPPYWHLDLRYSYTYGT